MADQKDTVYIDVDDEITAIIDKVQDSTAKIVALVLPKRAAALQSIVNMKLLKRTADDSGKHVVLITSEAALLPLAGAVGVYTAKNLQSKPEVPAAPAIKETAKDDEAVPVEDAETAEAKAVGERALEDTVAIDNGAKPAKTKASKSKQKAGKKPKVPNFEKFRSKLFLIIGGVIALLVLWYLAVFVAPSAKIVISANTEDVSANVQFTASTTANSVSVGDKIVPAKEAEKDEEATETAPATGQKDLGAKASGTVTFSMPCSPQTPPTIPKGTGVSAEGLTFITQSSVTLSPQINNGCNFRGSSKVSAQNNGEQYNIEPASYTVSGFSQVSATGSAMTGGSSKIAKVVTDQDVEAAKAKMNISDDTIKAELKKQLEDQGYFAITDSFDKSNEKTDISPKVGAEGNEVRVTYSATYSMLGVKRDDLKALLAESIKDQIDPERQQIQEDGLDQATFTVKDRQSGATVMSVSTTVAVGPNINTDQLKTDIAGKKRGEAENIIRALPGVKDVTVDYNPFWVNKAPKKASKITIEFQQAE